MEESQRKKMALTDRKKKIIRFLMAYTALFLVTFLLAFSPFLQEGKTFIWNGDGREQHYPTLMYAGLYLRQIVLNLLQGEIAIPLFDINLAMGSDVIATLNYYGFGNPLYLLSAFVPAHYTEYLYDLLVVIRIYLTGLSFSALCAYHKKPLSHALVGALMYMFSGYVIYTAIRHVYFIEPMIQLPLLLIGIDQIMQRKRPTVFILTVFYSALCGFYFLYMMTLMLAVYVLVRFFDHYQRERVKEFVQMAGRITGSYLLGIGVSAPMFLPSVVGYLSSGRSGAAENQISLFYGWSYYRDNFLRSIAPPASWDWLSLAALVVPAVFLLFTQKKKYRTLKILLAVGLIVYVLPVCGSIMNGFSYASQRWTFAAALLLSYIVVEMLPILVDLNWRQQMGCALILLAYGAVVFVGKSNRSVYYVAGTAMLAMTLFALVLVGNMRHAHGKKERRSTGIFVCILVVVINVSVIASYTYAKDQWNYIGEFTENGAETERLEWVLEREAEPFLDEKAGRFDSSSFTYNSGAVWRVPTMCTFWSITNKYISDFYMRTENVEQQISAYMIAGTNWRAGMNELLSTKYFIDRKDRTQYVPYGYKLIGETERENLVYENQYALPWGYTYDSYMPYEQMEAMNGLQREEAMLQCIALEENTNAVSIGAIESSIREVPYEITERNNLDWNNGILTVAGDNAAMTLEFQMPVGVEGYLRLGNFTINGSGHTSFYVTAECAGLSKRMLVASPDYTWYYGRENYLVNLGYSDEERTACTITFPKEGTYHLEDIRLFAMPMDEYPERVEALRAEPLENIEFGTNRITGTVDLSKNKILCLSIPYSRGWTARVDGEKVDILQGNYMFMALPLEAGHHDIEFTYFTPGLRAGIICCLASLGILAYCTVRERRKKVDLA